MLSPEQENTFFQIALAEAALAPPHEDIPVGAVVVDESGNILAQAHNQREQEQNPVGHAEVIALQAAAKKRGHWNLSGCRIFVTLEPCPLCMSAMMLSRIAEVAYLAKDEKGGAESLSLNLNNHPKLNHRFPSRRGGNAQQQGDAANLLRNFFREKRNK